MFEIKRTGDYAMDICLGLILSIAGVFALIVAWNGNRYDDDYFQYMGVLLAVIGLVLILYGFRNDCPKEGYLLPAMFAAAGLILVLSDSGEIILYSFLVVALAEFGLKMLFGMGSLIRIRFDDEIVNITLGIVSLTIALILAWQMENMYEFFMYLLGLAAIAFGTIYAVAVYKNDPYPMARYRSEATFRRNYLTTLTILRDDGKNRQEKRTRSGGEANRRETRRKAA